MPKKSHMLDRKKNLYLKHTKTKGRGVFCTANIKEDEELEMTPALILTEKENDIIEKTILNDYVFTTGKISQKMRKQLGIKKLDGTSCIVMGIGSYCNHDENPNAEIVWEEHDGTLYYTLRATRNIPKNTEICTSYGDTWFAERN